MAAARFFAFGSVGAEGAGAWSAEGNALGGFDGSFSGALKGRGESVRVGNPLPFDERKSTAPNSSPPPVQGEAFLFGTVSQGAALG